jgi:hypothetical protein
MEAVAKAKRPAGVGPFILIFAACSGRIAAEQLATDGGSDAQSPLAGPNDGGPEVAALDGGTNVEASAVVDAGPVVDVGPPDCEAPTVTCGTSCVDITTDPENCGGCDAFCAGNCGQGMCTPRGGW